ncbi:polysaccharide deacetylase family protein [Cohnella fermenti]|uniref:Polysaccharide deacetylase family protein n=1 Tax=Cohnella fermenti TaxID=2565925 RepID=A0A4S4BTC5_9BACL|nr:polysaccharide deacetylase family protein [Cohnella fermenti]THF78344.1 polysaccharide deacetylase family protein [Cohnella fermenti]
MRRLSAAAAIPVLLYALSACGHSNSEDRASLPTAASSAGTQAPSASASPALPSAPAAEAASSAPAASASSEESAEPSSAADNGVPLYRMNANYDIVPIDKDKTERKVVLLTFDDGPKDSTTLAPILDTLDKHHAKAIFFVNGYRVKKHPELLQEIFDRGQTIGNHSWDHIQLGKESADTIRKQLSDVQDIVKATVGSPPVFFRPPHGSGNADTHAIAKELGLLYMTWSDGSLDWEMSGDKIKDKTAAITRNITDQLHAGSNILMHELSWTAEALDSVLTTLEDKGYSFVDPGLIDVSDQP